MFIKEAWLEQTSSIIKRVRPDLSGKELRQFLDNEFEKHFTDNPAKIYNSYDEIIIDTTLARVLDWIQVEKPYISESGCFFKNRHDCRNLNAEIIRGQLDTRKVLKKEMFIAKQAGDVIQEVFKNVGQLAQKRRANSGYGAEANETSFLFNAHSAMSITAAGRSQLSVAGMCFENFFGDFVKFSNMDEMHIYIHNILMEKKSWQYNIAEIINIIPSEEDFVNRLCWKFADGVQYNRDVIINLYHNLGDEEVVRIYYTSNMKQFLKNKTVSQLLRRIMIVDVEFIDPNDIPKDIKAEVLTLIEIMLEFVGYRHQPFRYEDKMKNTEKYMIIVSDTDSNFLYFGDMVRYCMKEILPVKLFRKDKDMDEYVIRLVNIMCVLASSAVGQTLWNYLDRVGVEDDFKGFINMKNEFFLAMVGVTFAKKSYFGILNRQEGYIYPKPELDVKGVNFFKSTSTERTTEFIYEEILMGSILQPKDGQIDIRKIMKKITEYEDQMYNAIRTGDMGYLKRSVKVKTPDAYKSPMSTAYRGVYIWNTLADKDEQIELPGIITQVKVNIKSKKNLAALADYPEIYEQFVHMMDNDPNLRRVGSDGKEKFIGINTIALPYGMDDVPEWILSIIDVETIVSDNMKLFAQLFRPLGLNPGTSSHNGSSHKYYTNIIKL